MEMRGTRIQEQNQLSDQTWEKFKRRPTCEQIRMVHFHMLLCTVRILFPLHWRVLENLSVHFKKYVLYDRLLLVLTSIARDKLVAILGTRRTTKNK